MGSLKRPPLAGSRRSRVQWGQAGDDPKRPLRQALISTILGEMNSLKNYYSRMSWQAVALLAAGLFFCSAALLAADSDEANIEKTYYAWVRATNDRDIVRWSTFLAPGAFFAPPGIMPLDSEEAILNFYRDSFADPEFSLDCELLAVDVAESRDMAWARGTCRATFTDSYGQRAKGTSRWFKIWLKQTDGSWKCRINTWNYEGG